MNIINGIAITECSCEKCSLMCHAPCCGTPSDMLLLSVSGFGERLMYDNLPGGEPMIKPALKGYEGEISPWEVFSMAGCTFWKDGKCELHDLGLKPTQGKLANHDLDSDQHQLIADFINESWENDKGLEAIKKWKEINADN